jgi:hypothetical protein
MEVSFSYEVVDADKLEPRSVQWKGALVNQLPLENVVS